MTPDAREGEATGLLISLRRGGDAGTRATAALTELLYPELRRLAARLMRQERQNHTLQPTAVVHEVVLRLVDQERIDWQDRAHFLGIAAVDQRAAAVAELRIFGGLTVREITQELGVSPRTVNADWAMARLWLARELARHPTPGPPK